VQTKSRFKDGFLFDFNRNSLYFIYTYNISLWGTLTRRIAMKTRMILCLMILFVVSSDATADIIGSPVCIGTATDDFDIRDGFVVWRDSRNGRFDIYGYDLSTRTEFPICTNGFSNMNPSIGGGIVVWQSSNETPAGSSIRGYNLLTKEKFMVAGSSTIFNFSSPKVNDGFVTWYSRNGIHGYNRQNSNEFMVSYNRDNCNIHSMDDNFVVWSELRDGKAGMYSFNLSNGETNLISLTPGFLYQTKVDDGVVVWADKRSTASAEDIYALYGYDLTTEMEFLIYPGSGHQRQVIDIDGDTIIFSYFNGVDNTVCGYDMALAQAFPILTLPMAKRAKIDDGAIAWINENSIYYYAGAVPEPSTMAMLISGLIGCGLLLRLRRRK
jgi:beta propeller repeat protein